MSNAAFPVLKIEMFCVAEEPTATLPKLPPGPIVSDVLTCAGGTTGSVALALVKPVQPA
jgi:hypothetical protein